MKEYFIAIMTSSVVSAICVSLSSGTVYEKYVKYVCALICASVMVFPLSGFLDIAGEGRKDMIPSYVEACSVSSGTVAAPYAEDRVKDYIFALIKEKFGIIPKDVSIEIDIGNEITVGGITVTLESGDGDKTELVGDFLLSSLGSGIRVTADE